MWRCGAAKPPRGSPKTGSVGESSVAAGGGLPCKFTWAIIEVARLLPAGPRSERALGLVSRSRFSPWKAQISSARGRGFQAGAGAPASGLAVRRSPHRCCLSNSLASMDGAAMDESRPALVDGGRAAQKAFTASRGSLRPRLDEAVHRRGPFSRGSAELNRGGEVVGGVWKRISKSESRTTRKGRSWRFEGTARASTVKQAAIVRRPHGPPPRRAHVRGSVSLACRSIRQRQVPRKLVNAKKQLEGEKTDTRRWVFSRVLRSWAEMSDPFSESRQDSWGEGKNLAAPPGGCRNQLVHLGSGRRLAREAWWRVHIIEASSRGGQAHRSPAAIEFKTVGRKVG